MIILPISIYFTANNLYLVGIFLMVFILFIYFNWKVDQAFEDAKQKEIPRSKKKIKKFLKTYGVNHSKIYKEIATQLERNSEEHKKSFNLYPQINIILPVIILLLSLLAYDNPGYIVDLFVVCIVITFIFLTINPLINTYSDTFFNTKSERMLRLSRLVNEIYLDELIKENYSEWKPKT